MLTLTNSTAAVRLAPTITTTPDLPSPAPLDWATKAAKLLPRFASRAAQFDESDQFVAENYADLKAERFFSAGVPTAFGGGGASYEQLCDIVRTVAHGCSSTALALSMHYHLVAAAVWRWQYLKAPVEAFLTRLAVEQLVLVSSGGSDWLQSSGTAEAVLGGYCIRARKVFSSGCPAGDLLMTSAVVEDPKTGPTVIHFPVSLRAEGVSIVSTWRTLGMRGTGSNDVMLDGVFVPESAISLRRPRGRWHPAMHLVAKIALPMIYSTYVGVAESARKIALRETHDRRAQAATLLLAGEMENELFNTRLAHRQMLEVGAHLEPGSETTNGVLMARALLARSAVATVDRAIELVGGRSFYRNLGLERLYRDIQAARFHPMPEKPQQEMAGRMAFGLSLDAA